MRIGCLLSIALCLAVSACDRRPSNVIRIGHFPNVTHSQGVIAQALSRDGKGWFEERLGPGIRIEWIIYNAGPSAMETIFSGDLDLTYVGPNPALNAYMKSNGDEIRLASGSVEGGAALVVQGDGRIQKPEDFRGKKIATPQLGNTQDVACRAWLLAQGFQVTQSGGDAKVLPTPNPEIVTLFLKGEIDAAWTVEPWVSRLIIEGKGKVFLEERDPITTILVSSVRFIREHPDLAKKIARAQAELTEWIGKNTEKAQEIVLTELEAETHSKMSPEVLKMAWNRLRFTSKINRASFEKSVKEAQQIGFIQESVDLSKLFEFLESLEKS